MSGNRIHDYSAPPTLRRQLNQDLAKALAYQKAGKPEKVETWVQRLWRHMLKARLVSGGDHARYVGELRYSLDNEP